jgi:hypothetical protein
LCFIRDWKYQMALQKLQYLCTVHHHLGHGNEVCTRLSLWNSYAALNVYSCADWIQLDRASWVYVHASACAYMRAEQSICNFVWLRERTGQFTEGGPPWTDWVLRRGTASVNGLEQKLSHLSLPAPNRIMS